METRSFELFDSEMNAIVHGNNMRSIFYGLSPKEAAKRAFKSIAKDYYNISKKYPTGYVKFALIECTKNCTQNVYFYKGICTELINPLTLITNGSEKHVKYMQSVSKWTFKKDETNIKSVRNITNLDSYEDKDNDAYDNCICYDELEINIEI